MKKTDMVKKILENYVFHINSLNYDMEYNKDNDMDIARLASVSIVAEQIGCNISKIGKAIDGKWFYTGAILTFEKKSYGLWALRYNTKNMNEFKEEFKKEAIKTFPEIEFLF